MVVGESAMAQAVAEQSARIAERIDISHAADLLQPGDEFDVITLDEHGVDVKVGKVVAAEPETHDSHDFDAMLARNADVFAKAAEDIVKTPAFLQATGRVDAAAIRSWKNSRRSTAEQKRVAKSRAKFKAQKRARKASRGKR